MQRIRISEEYKKLGTVEQLSQRIDEENVLKFYYCESEDSYLIGRRIDTIYYAHWYGDHFT